MLAGNIRSQPRVKAVSQKPRVRKPQVSAENNSRKNNASYQNSLGRIKPTAMPSSAKSALPASTKMFS
ncbi:hypothetical protein BX592_104283 [Paraburkholderia rhizosphaerae]|uniref:Uncharacterized protein n=1 Tax=Paraburkholderia rhizosphaerae TaxID=480658 RepID=A0A4R8LXQ8_9BURK|nr:hypothetical protein BX592_104283 [Paraburkholderia rhizosphaerae]